MPAVAASRSTQALNDSRSSTCSARSGRNVGYTFVARPGRGDRLMMVERIGRIVGRADRANVELLQDAVRGQLVRVEPFVRRLPDRRRRLLVEQLVDAEVAPQLEMGPVIERIAQALRHGRGPRQELLVRRGVAGAEALRHPVGPHRAPFVVIALEPDLEQVREPPVAGDVSRRQMAVIIENRLPGRILVIQPARRALCSRKSSVMKGMGRYFKRDAPASARRARLPVASCQSRERNAPSGDPRLGLAKRDRGLPGESEASRQGDVN